MKPVLLKGTRDFSPTQCRHRTYIFDTIRKQFELFGFNQLETPAMERLETLTGKYGEEGDQLLFKILNNGDFLAKVDQDVLSEKNSVKATHQLSKRGLRYDLTVPFARFVAMNRSELAFPFKRYQIQPVWRADKPQKGRYQEFYQCDADVVGSHSLTFEADFIRLFDRVFSNLGVAVEIQLNNRKVLAGIVESIGQSQQLTTITVIIDKIDKIGKDGVSKELSVIGLSSKQVEHLINLIDTKSIIELKEKLKGSRLGVEGIEELESVISMVDQNHIQNDVVFNPSLARGLNYYTGTIFELKAKDVAIGSVAAGGRYDDLTATFGLKDVSGVGISFGAERIYDVMKELDMFDLKESALDVLLIGMDNPSLKKAFELASDYRSSGIRTDIFPTVSKMKKVMTYADRIQVPFVGIIGENELASEHISLKNMRTGEQQLVGFQELKNMVNL